MSHLTRIQTLSLPNISFPSSCLSCILLFAVVKPLPVIICEKQKGIISCQNGRRIDVLNASYGRLDRHTCSHGPKSNINCRSGNSLQIVQGKCNGQIRCELQVENNLFGSDPCPRTFKYLRVKYRCLEYIGKWENDNMYSDYASQATDAFGLT